MSVCNRIQAYIQRHELVADLFSLLGVALLLGTIWVIIDYQSLIFDWAQENVVLHVPILIAALGINLLLVFALICLGSGKCAEGEGSCFRTFKGRRHGTSLGSAFHSWLRHMEHVGRKHR